MKELDALLVNPKNGLDFGAALTPPYNILSIASELYSENFNVSVIDQRIDSSWKKDLAKELKKNPLCVGISAMTGVPIKHALEVAELVRKETDGIMPIVWGGIHPSILPKQTLENEYVDIVVRGEGEKTFKELLVALEKKTSLKKVKGLSFFSKKRYTQTPDRPLLDMNSLHDTCWDLVDVHDYIQKDSILKGTKRELDIGETSRGCPFRCKFCYSPFFHKGKWRGMSSKKTFEKIRWHVEKFKLDCVWIRDDSFFTDLKRVEEVTKLIVKEKLGIRWYASGMHVKIFNNMSNRLICSLKKSRCENLHFGIESGSDRILKMMGKGITIKEVLHANKKAKKYGIIPSYTFIIGFPTETIKEILQTLSLIKRLKKENPYAKIQPFHIFTPYPGTALFDVCKELGSTPPNKLEDWADYDMSKVLSPTFTEKEKNLIKNIRDISQLSSDFIQFLPLHLKLLSYPIHSWAKWRWKNNYFKFAPEMRVVGKLRDAITKK